MANTNILKEHILERLSSHELQEIISRRPHWIIRRGNFIFFIILLGLLSLAWFVKYPDTVSGHVKLTAINTPKLLVAKTDGKLQKLLVANEAQVRQGDPLAFLQSTASHQEILVLLAWINRVQGFVMRDSPEILSSDPLPVFGELGEVQPAYQDLQDVAKETVQVLTRGYYQQKKQALIKDLQCLTALQTNAQQERALLRKDYELQQIEYNANAVLAKDKIVSQNELNQDQSKTISKEMSLQQMDAQMINNDLAIHNKLKEILDLHKFITDQAQKFRTSLLNLKSRVEEWRQRYIVTATESGKVLFASFLQENELINNNQELFYVQPEQSQFYGRLSVSQSGLGKIKSGQKVLIRMDSYPSSEFGYLTGYVDFIPAIPNPTDSFLIKVVLPNGLRTNYNKSIFFRNNLSGQAEVITSNRRLLERLMGGLRDAMHHQ
jgi:HlyD family secretion protein